MSDEELVKKLREEYAKAISVKSYQVGDSEVTKQNIEALSREIDKLEERINRKREGVRSFYV